MCPPGLEPGQLGWQQSAQHCSGARSSLLLWEKLFLFGGKGHRPPPGLFVLKLVGVSATANAGGHLASTPSTWNSTSAILGASCMEISHPQQPGNGPVAIKASLEVAVHQGSALHPGESSLLCWKLGLDSSVLRAREKWEDLLPPSGRKRTRYSAISHYPVINLSWSSPVIECHSFCSRKKIGCLSSMLLLSTEKRGW